jgi:hypothetical protein
MAETYQFSGCVTVTTFSPMVAFQALAVASMILAVDWDAPVETDRSFGGAYYLHHQGDNDSTFETSSRFYQTTRRSVSEIFRVGKFVIDHVDSPFRSKEF